MWLYGHNELTLLIAWTKNTYIQCKASFAKGIPNKWKYLQPVFCWDIFVTETL